MCQHMFQKTDLIFPTGLKQKDMWFVSHTYAHMSQPISSHKLERWFPAQPDQLTDTEK